MRSLLICIIPITIISSLVLLSYLLYDPFNKSANAFLIDILVGATVSLTDPIVIILSLIIPILVRNDVKFIVALFFTSFIFGMGATIFGAIVAYFIINSWRAEISLSNLSIIQVFLYHLISMFLIACIARILKIIFYKYIKKSNA